MSVGKTAVLVAALTAATCGQTAIAQDYSQAPDFQAQVDAGELPPLADRLPEPPLVLEPLEEVGKYGGTWRSALKGTFDNGWIRRTVAYQPLLAFDYNWAKVVPNIAESYEANEDATEYTFHLRKGHKWSDGEPFTAEDLAFALNDIMKNPDYSGEKAQGFDWANMTGEAIDDVTFKITLEKPDGLLLQQIASVNGPFFVQAPKHYCSQFVPTYNENAEQVAKDRGFDSWSQAIERVCFTNFTDEKRPTLNAWRQLTPYDGINQLIEFERNPYFFKVDPEGQQLPYIDRVTMVQSENVEDILLKVINGEVDFSNRHFATVTNKPVIYDGQEAGNYHLVSTIDARMNTGVLQFNLTHEDPAKRELYQNHDFRAALSMGIDRQEIVDVIYAGQGEPYQAAPRPESEFYNEELAKQYTEYDPDKANEMLDAMGLDQRNGDGIRLDKNGNPIRIQLYTPSDQVELNDIAQLIVGYWSDLGIDLDQRNVERSFVYETFQSNKHDLHMWWGDGGLGDAILDPRYYFPMNNESAFAYKWAQWFINPEGAGAEEPSDAAKKQIELYRELKASADPEKQAELFSQIIDIAQDEFWVIGTVLPAEGYAVAKNNLGNVPEAQPYAWIYPQPGPMGTSQFFFKD
ncbi:ABC transporter substrate-binding protein [Pseudoruegeria sp. HB172150]|uniref:ABC transporter substrate-binding protein n=1 Tax=Pseudoruegeria sp. HB172150 TaxID=2721164 RepID=UPI0015575CB2|nr:ABC transporter substrate-binding protein [Pseudoruegeria sp. HB172150]